MDKVNNRRELETNLAVLEGYRNSRKPGERELYRKLIERGRCFVVWKASGSLVFGPSRFVGYAGNSARAHEADQGRQGNKSGDRSNLGVSTRTRRSS